MKQTKRYTTSEHAQAIRDELIKQIPDCEFSVEYKHRFCTAYIVISLMSAPFNAILDNKTYVQVNKDDMERKITEKAIEVIKKAKAIADIQSKVGMTDDWPFLGFDIIMEIGDTEAPFRVNGNNENAVNNVQLNYLKARSEMNEAVKLSGKYTDEKLAEMGLDIVTVYESGKDEIAEKLDSEACEKTDYFGKLDRLIDAKKALIEWVFAISEKCADKKQKETLEFLKGHMEDFEVEEKVIALALSAAIEG